MKTDDLLKLAEQDPELRDKLLDILANHEARTKPGPAVAAARMFYDIPLLPDNFQELEPGTYTWIQYWAEHPEEQEEMLRYRCRGSDACPEN